MVVVMVVTLVCVLIVRYNFPHHIYILPRSVCRSRDLSVVIVGFSSPKSYLRSFFGRVGARHVTIVEPDPLKKNDMVSELGATRSTLICGAVRPGESTASSGTLYRHTGGCSLFYPDERDRRVSTIKCRLFSLAEILQRHRRSCAGRVDVLIVNISGAEYGTMSHWLSGVRSSAIPRCVLVDTAEMNVQQINTLKVAFECHDFAPVAPRGRFLPRLRAKTTLVSFMSDNVRVIS